MRCSLLRLYTRKEWNGRELQVGDPAARQGQGQGQGRGQGRGQDQHLGPCRSDPGSGSWERCIVGSDVTDMYF